MKACSAITIAGLFFCKMLGAQTTAPGDCNDAIHITNGYYDMPGFAIPVNNIPDEISADLSCLSGGEMNGFWFEFLVLDSGTLSFNVMPYNFTDDYDWALFDITYASCFDIYYVDSLELRCNYSNSVTNYGITGANGGVNNQDEPTVQVFPGQLFKLFVSSYSAGPYGFQLDFSSSTFTFDQSIGIEKNEIVGKVKIGPNPSNDYTAISFDASIIEKIKSVELLNVHGQKMMSYSPPFSNPYKINTSHLQAGLYFLQILTSNQQHSCKLIVR